MIKQQEAVKRMKETAKRANNSFGNMPPTPSFVTVQGEQNSENTENKDTYKGKNNEYFPNFDFSAIPFLTSLKEDKDFSLILGLLLVLLSEKSDKLLLVALLYILL